MEKRIYQAPLTEQIYVDMSRHLLDILSINKGAIDDPENDGTPDAKRNMLDDDIDFFDDEEDTGINWSFNVWGD